MNYQRKIETIRYALDHLHVHGRKSLEAILSAMRNLSTWDGLGKGFDYKMIQLLLDEVVVSGEEDINRLLACIQMLDELMGDEKNDSPDK